MSQLEKKPRCDSRLKNLPEERQGEIADYAAEHGLVKCAAWLRDDGVATSKSALGEFLGWLQLRGQFREDESTAESLVEQLKKEVPALSEEQLDEMGQRTFSLLSIRRQDLGGFVKVRSARSKAVLEREKLKLREVAEKRLQESLGLQREKFQRETCELFLKWAEDKRAKGIVEKGVSNAEKIERLGELMFGEDWK